MQFTGCIIDSVYLLFQNLLQMEINTNNNGTQPSCLLCENGNITELECCKFCNQVWYCKQRVGANDSNGSLNGIKNNKNDMNGEVNGSCELAETENAFQDTATSEKPPIIEREGHSNPHRPYGLSYCLPFKGM